MILTLSVRARACYAVVMIILHVGNLGCVMFYVYMYMWMSLLMREERRAESAICD